MKQIRGHIFLFVMVLLAPVLFYAQKPTYTHADSLKGCISKERSWWDLLYYDLSVTFSISDSTISGFNWINYKVLVPGEVMQIDLMQPMQIDSIFYQKKKCTWKRDGDAFFVNLPVVQIRGMENKILIYFHGKPKVAKLPPWDGGVVWQSDSNGFPWVSIACQGMSARVWFPNKDHMYDEVEGCSIRITAPDNLVSVSNGRLKSLSKNKDGTSTSNWQVNNPINNYSIIPYIGKYVNFNDTLLGEGGILDLNYWVLENNLEKAKRQFRQVKSMIHCFEYWFGKYPFYEDSYKLIEAPFLGMEHQSAIAYGNDYMNGYKGRDLSLTGYGMNWDFIIVHESGHEWFGNSISAKDVADNWVHEGFTAYAENLYVEYLYGKKAGAEYVIGTRQAILNDKPIISDYNVNSGGSIDLYYKGANMLHTIRQLVNNDSIWRALFRGLNKTFYHQTVSTSQIEIYMMAFLNMDLKKVFDQYLRTTKIPELEYRIENGKLFFRWTNCISDFNMPLRIVKMQGTEMIFPEEKWKEVPFKDATLNVDANFFVKTKP
ncbi:MAG: M1 family metallopeptidase [bacterium]|nr:M1 family metallopeptidase [bacterium]